ncbi:MAG: hypothetical protein HGA45_17240 [Chloroflexales bacterium]|nr:hypothetical protein [Chloroflexales bacterium]
MDRVGGAPQPGGTLDLRNARGHGAHAMRGESSAARAAASSLARGSPSKRAQIAAIAAAFDSVS